MADVQCPLLGVDLRRIHCLLVDMAGRCLVHAQDLSPIPCCPAISHNPAVMIMVQETTLTNPGPQGTITPASSPPTRLPNCFADPLPPPPSREMHLLQRHFQAAASPVRVE